MHSVTEMFCLEVFIRWLTLLLSLPTQSSAGDSEFISGSHISAEVRADPQMYLSGLSYERAVLFCPACISDWKGLNTVPDIPFPTKQFEC